MICPACSTDNLPGSEICRSCWFDLTQHDQPTAQDRVERSLMDDPVSVLHPQVALTIPLSARVGEAMKVMVERNIGALPVVGENNELLGIFSERDLLDKVGVTDPHYAERPVREFMTRNPEAVRETDFLRVALHKMDSGGYRHLPVVRDGKVVGIISVRDMLRHIARLCSRVE
jgi:CBS domain-containing protein